MIEEYLTKDETSECSALGAFSAMNSMEKKALSWAGAMSALKSGGKALPGLFGGGAGVVKGGVETAKDYVRLLAWTMGTSAALGVGAGIGYNVLKDRLQRKDPEEKFNDELEAMYVSKARERADADWMDRARAQRDDLRRNWKRMPADEYARKYDTLLKTLDERKG